MTKSKLKELRAKALAATPGEWEFSSSVDLRRGSVFIEEKAYICGYDPDDMFGKTKHENVSNFKHIAANNPQTTLALIDALEVAVAGLTEYTGADYKEVRGKIIEYDVDAGPLYERYTVPCKDNGEKAQQALKTIRERVVL